MIWPIHFAIRANYDFFPRAGQIVASKRLKENEGQKKGKKIFLLSRSECWWQGI